MYDSNETTERIRETVFKLTKKHRIATSAAIGASSIYIPPEDRAEFK
jgi:hypothetical protein